MAERDPSILLRLQDEGREVPRVRLRETEPDGPALPKVDLRQSGRFEIVGALAQGGVGEVMKGRDADLGRDVALKLLRRDHIAKPDLVQRFVEEAQIGGQLQHPGIVPVYELGLDDGRPFFAMKLVKGETLASLLKEREDPGEDRHRLLQIYEQLCQTIAYAHSRGVVHRDLKPSNVMIGAFGEVQVLDWGFAKVLPRGGIADERPAAPEVDVTRIATVRSKAAGSESIAGSVMGTPAYMPPEQALGRVELLDERSDVFSLGAILCEILTGKPPYADEEEDLLLQAAQAQLTGAHERLDACSADGAVVDLARNCLNPARRGRPRNASVLAERIHAHLATVEERAHRAALAATRTRHEAEQARMEATEQQRARRLSVLLAASVLLILLAGGGGWLWLDHVQRTHARTTARAVDAAIAEANDLRGDGRFAEAWAAAERAAQIADGADAATRARTGDLLAAVRAQEEEARHAAEQAEAERAFVAELDAIRLLHADDYDHRETDGRYAEAFRRREVDPEALAAEEIAARLQASFPGALVEIAATLDEWASLRRTHLEGPDWEKLADVARAIDSGPWRTRLREAADPEALRALAKEAMDKDPRAQTLGMLGRALATAGEEKAAIELYREVHRLHPDDFWVNVHLGWLLEKARPAQCEEAARFYAAALAVRPESPCIRLVASSSLIERGRCEEALVLCRDAARMSPEEARAHDMLGLALRHSGRLNEAISAHREALRIRPNGANTLYNAACTAALAAAGEGDAADADAPERASRRAEALAWLRTMLELAPANPAGVRKLLVQARSDSDLAAVRDELDALPEDERQAWRGFWAAVEKTIAAK